MMTMTLLQTNMAEIAPKKGIFILLSNLKKGINDVNLQLNCLLFPVKQLMFDKTYCKP